MADYQTPFDIVMPRAKTPLIEGARVRITYRDTGEDRIIRKFEIAAANVPSGTVE